MNDEENSKLLEEIDKLGDDITEESIKKPANFESLILALILIIVVIAAAYSYYKDDINEEVLPIAVENEKIDNDYTEVTYDEYYGNQDEELIDYDMDEETAKLDFENKKKNLVISQNVININNKLIACIENKNKSMVFDFEVYAIFYDGENNIIGIDEQNVDTIHANQKQYLRFENTPENFERTEIFINKNYFYMDSTTKYLTNKVEIKDKIVDGDVEISVTNKSDKKIDRINLTVVYYDEKNQILDIEDMLLFDIKKNKSETEQCFGIRDEESYDRIKFDHYDVNLNFAINYNY